MATNGTGAGHGGKRRRPAGRLRAGEVMSSPVITVDKYMTLREAAQEMTRSGVSGLVVRNPLGRGVGVVTASDIVRHLQTRARPVAPAPDADRPPPQGRNRLGETFTLECTQEACVADAMTPFVVTVDARAPLAGVARLMGDKKIHRVLVEDGGRIVGIVTGLDIARALGRDARVPEAVRDDANGAATA